MVGSIIYVLHGELDADSYYRKGLGDERIFVPLAPGDGLMLEKAAYGQYNKFPTTRSKIEIKESNM